MKKGLLAVALAAAQLLPSPAPAAELGDPGAAAGPTRVGGFAGARLRLTVGGRHSGEARMALALSPVRRSAGDPKLAFGEGVELRLSGRTDPAISLAGFRLSPGRRGQAPAGRRLGVSTVGAVAIGAGVVLASAVAIALAVRSGEE
ncbi:MAG: hypothetical protein JOZ90_05740 [Alphaproteobacteria bacterium]|nr:hypothetical protein [Alphaproteobacteria bacterium]MBV9370678.1 hypothetical protein [Alphaproteobacteria bacterium]MBV9900583.1 hypothetical protein [Alphaproteobacteria bacterium]